MITIDNRVGSKELYSMLKDTPAQLSHLDFADFAFLGRGADDCPLAIGIERKKIMDLLQSMTSGRLSGYQIPGMLRTYHICYLIIEGYYMPSPKNGKLQSWKKDLSLGTRVFSAKEVYGYLHTLQVRRGIYLWRTHTQRETAQLIQILYAWWTNKNLTQHESYLAQHQEYADLSTKQKPFVERVAAELPGIGREKAKKVLKMFPTLDSMIRASVEDWMKIEGIGKTLAHKIIGVLRT